MQYSRQNAVLSYKYPCYVAINKSYFVDILEVGDGKNRLAGLIVIILRSAALFQALSKGFAYPQIHVLILAL